MATLRRVKREEITHEEMRRIWVSAEAGDVQAQQQMAFWHSKYPEWKGKHDAFLATMSRARNEQGKSKKKRPAKKSVETPWTKARTQFFESGKRSAFPVSGGLPTLGRRR